MSTTPAKIAQAPAAHAPAAPIPVTVSEPAARPWTGPGFGEFVGIVALMMAVTAMSIDNLLPAFPAIEARFGTLDHRRSA